MKMPIERQRPTMLSALKNVFAFGELLPLSHMLANSYKNLIIFTYRWLQLFVHSNINVKCKVKVKKLRVTVNF